MPESNNLFDHPLPAASDQKTDAAISESASSDLKKPEQTKEATVPLVGETKTLQSHITSNIGNEDLIGREKLSGIQKAIIWTVTFAAFGIVIAGGVALYWYFNNQAAATVPSATIQLDSDNDGLTDIEEQKYNTNPQNPDTDNDGFKDGEEVRNGYNPRGVGTL